MRRAALVPLALLFSFCAGSRGPVSTPTAGHGALTIEVQPNPVVATRVEGTVYDFPFDVVLRETGGHPVDVDRVSANVTALGGIQVAAESYDAARIASLGYSTHVPANGEVHYRFDQHRDVTNDRLFQGVSAKITVEAHDETSTPITTSTRISVTKR